MPDVLVLAANGRLTRNMTSLLDLIATLVATPRPSVREPRSDRALSVE